VAQIGHYHMAVTVVFLVVSRQSEYFLFRAKRIFPVLSWSRSSLSANNGEVDNHVFSVDEQNEENGWILALMGKKKFMS
jgi:hypothetical protein